MIHQFDFAYQGFDDSHRTYPIPFKAKTIEPGATSWTNRSSTAREKRPGPCVSYIADRRPRRTGGR